MRTLWLTSALAGFLRKGTRPFFDLTGEQKKMAGTSLIEAERAHSIVRDAGLGRKVTRPLLTFFSHPTAAVV